MEELQEKIIDEAHIHICLNCPKEECNNCFHKASSTGRIRRMWSESELKLIQNPKLSNTDIAQLTGRSRASVAARRRDDGIKWYASKENDYHEIFNK